jgi:hypothetical protein
MYDSKSPTSLIKKTVSPLGRKLYDDPVTKARKEPAILSTDLSSQTGF